MTSGRKTRADAIETRARIVAEAARLFAERGLEAVSLLEVGRAAGQKNRSAVQYHFGDKRGVVLAILDEHAAAIEHRREVMLDALEAQGAAGLRDLIDALVRPVADQMLEHEGGVAYVRISAELIGHPSHPLLELDSDRRHAGAGRLRKLVARVTPRLPEASRVPRWMIVTGMLFHGLADWSRQAPRRGASRDVFVNELIDAIAAVLEAPASRQAKAALRKSSPGR